MESDSYKADKLADQNVATRNYSKNRLIETEDEAEERERRVALMNKGLEPLIAIPEGSLFRKIIDNIHIPFGCLTVGYAVVLNNGLKNRKDVSTFYRRGLMIQLGLVSAGLFGAGVYNLIGYESFNPDVPIIHEKQVNDRT